MVVVVLGQDPSRPVQVHRDHRLPGPERQVGGPAAELLGPAVGRAAALGEDHQVPVVLQELGGHVGRAPVDLGALDRDGGQPVGQHLHMGGQDVKRSGTLELPLVHVEPAVELELNRMQPRRGVAVVLRDEPARVRLVAAHREPEIAQRLFDGFRHRTDTARAVAIAQHHVGARAFVLAAGRRRHGVAVDQHRRAELAMHAREQPP